MPMYDYNVKPHVHLDKGILCMIVGFSRLVSFSKVIIKGYLNYTCTIQLLLNIHQLPRLHVITIEELMETPMGPIEVGNGTCEL